MFIHIRKRHFTDSVFYMPDNCPLAKAVNEVVKEEWYAFEGVTNCELHHKEKKVYHNINHTHFGHEDYRRCLELINNSSVPEDFIVESIEFDDRIVPFLKEEYANQNV